MSSNVINNSPYLRTTREFPIEIQGLASQINKGYQETANAVNLRTIGIFPVNNRAIGGESWYFTTQKQQNFRQVYPFTTTANIAHGLNFSQIPRFVRNFGEFTDGTNWYGLIHGSPTAIAGQISFYITPTNIVFVVGAGAPAVTLGQVVLDWLSFA